LERATVNRMRGGRGEGGVAEELDALVRRLHVRHMQWQIECHDGGDRGDRALVAEAERDLVRYVTWVNGVDPKERLVSPIAALSEEKLVVVESGGDGEPECILRFVCGWRMAILE
jgi:hypothetical protein